METNKILEHQLEEWKYLNEYINKMDLGYQQIFALMISIFTGAVIVFTKNLYSNLAKGIFIIPLGIIGMMAYLSYQFRITAILRGHLAALEEKMNKQLEENVHMWNSALVEAFMAHNNLINNNMMLPMLIFIFFLAGYCIWATWEILVHQNFAYYKVVFVAYWFVIIMLFLIVIIPFFENEKIRYETYDEEKVWEKYRKYVDIQRDNYKQQKFYYEKLDDNITLKKDLIKNGILPAALVLIFGFIILNIFWHFADKSVSIKGLYDYYAATLGDGICLPVLVGTGTYFVRLYDIKEKYKILCRKGGLVFAGIGIAIQISWLLNPNIELNWTIDRVHHFNLAGWYHALFFVVMFYVISKVVMLALIVEIFSDKNRNIKTKISYMIMWFSGIGYWLTHMIDDCMNENNYGIWLIISIVFFIVVFIGIETFLKADVTYKMLFVVGVTAMHIMVYVFCRMGGLNWNVIEMFTKIDEAIR